MQIPPSSSLIAALSHSGLGKPAPAKPALGNPALGVGATIKTAAPAAKPSIAAQPAAKPAAARADQPAANAPVVKLGRFLDISV